MKSSVNISNVQSSGDVEIYNESEGETEDYRKEHGLSVALTSFFMVAQMAGAGFLALPRAMVDSGIIGFILLFVFCGSTGFASTKLGLSWLLLEERYPEYRKPGRQPYLDIAQKSLGPIGRKFAFALILIANIGSSTVFIILISELINSVFDQLSLCEYAVITAFFLMPFAWLGTPKDFWQASVFAVISTVIAVVIIMVKILLQYEKNPVYPLPTHPTPTFSTFFLSFGAILFAFGGSSVFPTIQNDMKERDQFWKSIIISFTTIVTLYFPIALVGYIYIGDIVDGNIILSLESSPLVSVAIVFEIFNLLGTFILTLSPVFLALEEAAGISQDFGPKRVLLRSGLIFGELIVALAFPDFGLIVNLIGGSAMSCLSFIFPPLMYMKLMDDKNFKESTEKKISLWERIYLWEIILVGVVGGIAATGSSLYALLQPESFSSSCFVSFLPQ